MKNCGCGSPLTMAVDGRRCAKCGGDCCSACAFTVESATYCIRCAESVFEADRPPVHVKG